MNFLDSNVERGQQSCLILAEGISCCISTHHQRRRKQNPNQILFLLLLGLIPKAARGG